MTSGEAITLTRQVLAAGDGWCASAVHADAGHRVFELRHELASIAVVTAGSFRYRSNQGTATLTAGAWLLGNAGRDYECSWPHATGDTAIVFHYAPECLADIARAIPAVTRLDFPVHRIPPIPAILPLGARVAAQSASGDAGQWEEIALRTAGEALAQASGAAEARRRPSGRDEARVNDALRIIERRYDEPLTLTELAAAARMSPYHFLRVFGDVVGVTPHQFLLRTRLLRAAAKLANGREPIVDIAFGTGFGDLSTFVGTFRRVFGVTPSEYRKTARRRPLPLSAASD